MIQMSRETLNSSISKILQVLRRQLLTLDWVLCFSFIEMMHQSSHRKTDRTGESTRDRRD